MCLVLGHYPIRANCQDLVDCQFRSKHTRISREFMLDRADLITPDDEQKIRGLCDKLLSDKATPIIVVTIESMAKYGGEGMRIETFATLLFDQWEIGQAEVRGQPWNTGILLLVSRDDRKARIQLGGYWRHDQDVLSQQIMNEQIVPRFKRGEFSAGITAGVESLEKMARGLKVPRPSSASPRSPPATGTSQPTPWWSWLLMLGLVAIVVLTIISLVRSGSNGWAWLWWGLLFSGLGYLFYQWMNQERHSSTDWGGDDWGGDGFSGGSFGGGFSGGGGATGSW